MLKALKTEAHKMNREASPKCRPGQTLRMKRLFNCVVPSSNAMQRTVAQTRKRSLRDLCLLERTSNRSAGNALDQTCQDLGTLQDPEIWTCDALGLSACRIMSRDPLTRR